MARGDHCAVYGCSNDRRYPEKQLVLPHGGILRFYSPKSQKDVGKWERLLNRRDFKVTLSTKVCSNHFKAGYRSKECANPTLYLKGYSTDKSTKRRPSPNKREVLPPKPKKRRRKNEVIPQVLQSVQPTSENDDFHIKQETKEIPQNLEETSNSQRASTGDDEKTQRRNLFIIQATSQKNCFRYTGITRPKLDLVFDLIKEKAKGLRYWKGSVDTPPSRREKRGAQPRLLTPWKN